MFRNSELGASKNHGPQCRLRVLGLLSYAKNHLLCAPVPFVVPVAPLQDQCLWAGGFGGLPKQTFAIGNMTLFWIELGLYTCVLVKSDQIGIHTYIFMLFELSGCMLAAPTPITRSCHLRQLPMDRKQDPVSPRHHQTFAVGGFSIA